MYVVTWTGGTALVEDDGAMRDATPKQRRALERVLSVPVVQQIPGGEGGAGEATLVLEPGDEGHVEAALGLLDRALVTFVPSGRANEG